MWCKLLEHLVTADIQCVKGYSLLSYARSVTMPQGSCASFGYTTLSLCRCWWDAIIAICSAEHTSLIVPAFVNLKFLTRQGVPLQDYGDNSDSNFMQLLKLHVEGDKSSQPSLRKKQTNIYHMMCRMRYWMGRHCQLCLIRPRKSIVLPSPSCVMNVWTP